MINDPWLKTSIMARRCQGKRHELSSRRKAISQPGRTHPARKHGRSKIYDGRVDFEKISGLMTYRQQRGVLQ